MILPTPLEICGSVREFFEANGEIEVPRPARCPCRPEECGSQEPMWMNGSYARQVIYWGLLFVLSITRFRCRKCGKTVSRPYSWLVPYRRFSAEITLAAVEAYATRQTSYREQSAELSEPEFVEPGGDIKHTDLYAQMLDSGAIKRAVTKAELCRPSHCAAFYWVEFIGKGIYPAIVNLLCLPRKPLPLLPSPRSAP